MSGPVTAYLGLGGNVGDTAETLAAAVFALHDADGIAVEDVSGFYETAPVGGVDQDPFLNCCLRIRTTLEPLALLDETQATEAAFGRDRDREVRWGPRTLDIDVLLYGGRTVDTERLVVPHPRMAERGFVLVPLLEVMPGGALPDGRRLTRLLMDLGRLDDIELVLRMDELPGPHVVRPEGPRGPGAFLTEEWQASGRAGGPGRDEGVDR